MTRTKENPPQPVARWSGTGWKSWGDFRISFYLLYYGLPHIASGNEVKTELGGRT